MFNYCIGDRDICPHRETSLVPVLGDTIKYVMCKNNRVCGAIDEIYHSFEINWSNCDSSDILEDLKNMQAIINRRSLRVIKG